jgi:hypothetical protein
MQAPVLLAIRPGEAEPAQIHVHSGEDGCVSRYENAPAFPLTFKLHIEMVGDFLQTA